MNSRYNSLHYPHNAIQTYVREAGPSRILPSIINENCEIRAIVPASNFPGRASVSRFLWSPTPSFSKMSCIIVMHGCILYLLSASLSENCKIAVARRVRSSRTTVIGLWIRNAIARILENHVSRSFPYVIREKYFRNLCTSHLYSRVDGP